jgi:hypothetical protein
MFSSKSRMVVFSISSLLSLLLGTCLVADEAAPAPESVAISANWNEVIKVSETVPTTQHLANALTLRTNPLNKPLLKDLRQLETNDTRLQFWFSVPAQAVAELKEPTASQTFWDFQYMDPVLVDFFANTQGVHHVNIGTIPRWMFKLPPVEIPPDPAASFYHYTAGTNGDLLKDPTGQQFADFQGRLFQWYTQGGFADEIGAYHASGYHYKIDYWGVLNEPNLENHISVQEYTRIFDAVAKKLHELDPQVQCFGPEVLNDPVKWERYFLDPKNHSADAPPVSWFSFHHYVEGSNDPASWQSTYFIGRGGTVQAATNELRQIVQIRDQLSPHTKLAIDEIGTFNIIKKGENPGQANEPYDAFNPLYWVATGAHWADSFIEAEKQGVSLISMTQMVGYGTQSPSTSMIDWDTAQPNAHYWILKLIAGNFGPGDQLVATQSSSSDVVAQASITSRGKAILLVNTANRDVPVDLTNAIPDEHLQAVIVDQATGEKEPRRQSLDGKKLTLAPFSVAVVSTGGQL